MPGVEHAFRLTPDRVHAVRVGEVRPPDGIVDLDGDPELHLVRPVERLGERDAPRHRQGDVGQPHDVGSDMPPARRKLGFPEPMFGSVGRMTPLGRMRASRSRLVKWIRTSPTPVMLPRTRRCGPPGQLKWWWWWSPGASGYLSLLRFPHGARCINRRARAPVRVAGACATTADPYARVIPPSDPKRPITPLAGRAGRLPWAS